MAGLSIGGATRIDDLALENAEEMRSAGSTTNLLMSSKTTATSQTTEETEIVEEAARSSRGLTAWTAGEIN